jgi:hypothetical protein
VTNDEGISIDHVLSIGQMPVVANIPGPDRGTAHEAWFHYDRMRANTNRADAEAWVA